MLNINFLPLIASLILNYSCLGDYSAQELFLEEKLGHLFVIPACPLRGKDHENDLEESLKRLFISNFILKQGTPETHVHLIKKLIQKSSQPPLFMIDAEWGLSMTLSQVVRFPKNLTLGAIQKRELLFQLGEEIGEECKALGIQMNLAPVVDINSNPLNPIIHMRSFGESAEEVSWRGVLLMQGMQKGGVLTCAKHFPGHGDTTVDSHRGLPLITASKEELISRELLPFKACIEGGVPAIMVAHLKFPALDELFPASLSEKIIKTLLKAELGFEGLVITDALNMQALTSLFSVEEIALRAYLAGNDLLLYGDHLSEGVDRILREDLPRAYNALKKAYEEGIITEGDLNARVQRILDVKKRIGLPSFEVRAWEKAQTLKRELYREAITLVKDAGGLLPLKEKEVHFISFGTLALFEKQLREKVTLSSESSTVIVALSEVSKEARETIMRLKREGKKVLVFLFTTPYALRNFPSGDAIQGDAFIMAYEEDEEAQAAALDLLFGLLKTSEGNGGLSLH